MNKKAITMMFQILLGLVAFGIVMFATTKVLAALLGGGPDHYPTVQSFKYLEKQIEQLEKHSTKNILTVPYYMAKYDEDEGIPFYHLRSNFGACKENELCLCKNPECTRMARNGKIKKKYKFTVDVHSSWYNVVRNVRLEKKIEEGRITEIIISGAR
jgi:hypothetical protein